MWPPSLEKSMRARLFPRKEKQARRLLINNSVELAGAVLADMLDHLEHLDS